MENQTKEKRLHRHFRIIQGYFEMINRKYGFLKYAKLVENEWVRCCHHISLCQLFSND
jgi:hypothetical protein